MERWHGKTAVVTGAGSGIGAAIARALADDEGLTVVALDKSHNHVQDSKTKMHESLVIPRICDISKADQLASEFRWVEETYGGVHIMVNNAGVLYEGQITDVGTNTLTDDQIAASVDTNVKGTIACTRLAVASMRRNNFDGHVININSLAGHYIPFSSSMNVYATTKYAVTAFTASLANELAHFNSNIKTTSISPGYTRTGMASKEDLVPMLLPSDIASAVLYVISTPPNVNISELTIQPVMEKRL